MSQAKHPTTVKEALAFAVSYWEGSERTRSHRGCNMMVRRAVRCAGVLGLGRTLKGLTASDGARLLDELRKGGLARATVAVTYAAGRRMLALAGVNVTAWPRAPTPPRRNRQPVDPADLDTLEATLEGLGYADTAALVALMRATGLRVEVEALNGDWSAEGGRLEVFAGKGGHSRSIPYRGPETGPLRDYGGVVYETHLRRIDKACREAGLPPIKPHDLRRHFVKRTYEKSGKDIRIAQVLAGHADPGTTAGYIGVDWKELENAIDN